jgi:arabinogalactan endo-1,4-beta-galactosidase
MEGASQYLIDKVFPGEIRICNNIPGNPGFTPSNRLPAGFQDQADVLKLSKRAKDMVIQIQLTFYYSDYWSNDKQHAWQNISFTALKDSVYQFTFKFMNRMKDRYQGSVQIGGY